MKFLTGRYSRYFQTIFIVVMITCAGFMQRSMNRARAEMGLTRLQPLENAPPVLAFTTVALGGFRGLISNMLWIRATQLQEDGKYFEMVQLADWITKLQPHFVTVWVHQAWNLAYNISVKFPDHQDRWLWVQRGIELLRDHGLKYNPQETMIYRELAWFFQHKMGANLDDANMLYKAEWAAAWDQLLMEGKPDYDVLLDPQTPEDKERVQVMRDVYKMDPAIMKEVDEEYGPFEWRLPESHGMYWAFLGLKVSEREKDYIQLRRVIFQGMQMAFLRGRMIEFPVADPTAPGEFTKAFEFGPNLEITDKTNRAYEEMMGADENYLKNIGTAHKNFLRTAVYFLYTHNRMNEAEKWYDYVREKYPDSITTSLEEYVFARVEEEFGSTSQDRLKGMLMGFIERSLIDIAMGQEEKAIAGEMLARKMRKRYYDEINDSQIVRIKLPTVQEMKIELLARLLDPEEGLNEIMANQLRTRLGLAEDYDPKKALGELRAMEHLEGPQPELQP
jgi:hypothetical protein